MGSTSIVYRQHTFMETPFETDDGEDESESSYVDHSSNDLTVLSGAMLIVADCMGTGILALPHDMVMLGKAFGLFFLILNLPINFYAGDILHNAAFVVENRLGSGHGGKKIADHEITEGDGIVCNEWNYNDNDNEKDDDNDDDENKNGDNHRDEASPPTERTPMQNEHPTNGISAPHTFDFVGITYALFDYNDRMSSNDNNDNNNNNNKISRATIIVTTVYYVNIFLVLGNYILVMSHAVAAMVGEDNICLPVAGIVASTLMFGIQQLRTMATLGRTASVISLTCLAIVVVQCLWEIQAGNEAFNYNDDEGEGDEDGNGNGDDQEENAVFWITLVRQLAAISSIGFAVGSQKLLLNIRHEFKDRNNSPRSLGIALVGFGSVYVLVCVMAGDQPPSFLFDAISSGPQRQLAGFLLWVHVAVSFAINSQALCSSLDRLKFYKVKLWSLNHRHKFRWLVLTFLVSIASYFIANSVPFFKDLVALIGALTSVPLTLLLPALFHRKILNLPLFWMGPLAGGSNGVLRQDIISFLLVAFSVIFLVCGVLGSLSSISIDWKNHGAPFSCH